MVDSGAEENVCPKWWGESVGLHEGGTLLNLRSASGGKFPHFGGRELLVEFLFQGRDD